MFSKSRGFVPRWQVLALAPSTLSACLGLAAMLALPQNAYAANKPNILVIFGDDIGQSNISRYTHGVVGYMTPNIDRVGRIYKPI